MRTGTLEWARTTRGALSRGEQLALARQAVVAQLRGLPSRLAARLAAGRGGELLACAAPPDSALARAAESISREASPAPLHRHALRCWLWGELFAAHDRISFDRELLYVAALLHDLALTDAHRAPGEELARCFAVHGAEVAAKQLRALGADAASSAVIAEAISLHMNPVLSPERGAEAYLLHEAAHLDVAGTRAGAISPAQRAAVIAAHPRSGFRTMFAQQMRREASERPASRAALMWRLGMPLAIATNPLDHARG